MNDAAAGLTTGANAGIVTVNDVSVADLTAGGGVVHVAAVNGVDINITGNAIVNQTGAAGGNVNVGGANVVSQGAYNPHPDFNAHLPAGNNITGDLLVNSTSASVNSANDVTGSVTLVAGKLKMHDAIAGGGAAVTVSSGELNMNDILGNRDLAANGGITTLHNAGQNVTLTNNAVVHQSGTVNGNLDVSGTAKYLGSEEFTKVNGAVQINTSSTDLNTIQDAVGIVTVAQGKLRLGNTTSHLIASGPNSDVEVTGNIGGNLTLGNAASKVSVKGDITGDLNGAGIVTFKGPGSAGAVGNNNPLTKVVIETTEVRKFDSIAPDSIPELNFAQEGTADFAAGDMGAIKISTAAPGTGKVIVRDNQILKAASDIGAIANLEVVGTKTVEIQTANFATSVIASAEDQVTVTTSTNASSKLGNLGSSSARLLAANFNITGGSVGDVYSKNSVIAAGVTQTFKGIISGIDLTLNDRASKAVFNDGAIIASKIKGLLPSAGEAHFEGSATINEDIVGLFAVNFRGGADKKVHLNKDIKATDIAFGELTVELKEADAALEGKTTATGTKFDLASKTLKVKPGSQLALVGNVAMKTVLSRDGTSAGNIKLDAGAKIALDGLTSLNVEIDDKTNGFDPLKGDVTFVLVDNSKGSVEGATLSIDKITHIGNGGKSFIKWIKKVNDENTISFTSADNTREFGDMIFDSASVEDKATFNIVAFDENVRKELLAMNEATIKETIERIVATEVEAVVSDVVSLIGSDIGARMGNLAGIQAPTTGSNAIVTSDATSGVAAGDDVSKYGIWSTPFFNKSVQKSRDRSAGYDASTGGASFGFDTRANDEMIIGAAFSFLNSDVKHKDHKSGDKTKVESLMFSIYGMQQLTDNWFAQGVVTFGSNSVKTNEKRVNSNTTSQTAEGKYSSMAFSSEALIGYNYSNGMVALTPMAGIRATRVNDGGYKETGTTNQNLTISKKASNKVEVVLGARFSGGTFDLGGLVLTPEVHGFIAQDLVAKNAKIDMRLDGSSKSLEMKRAKPNKTSYNVGIGMNAKYNMMEYGLGYDAHLAKNFVGHQGTLKVRVNF
jgi:outer membrane autotransporter protein